MPRTSPGATSRARSSGDRARPAPDVEHPVARTAATAAGRPPSSPRSATGASGARAPGARACTGRRSRRRAYGRPLRLADSGPCACPSPGSRWPENENALQFRADDLRVPAADRRRVGRGRGRHLRDRQPGHRAGGRPGPRRLGRRRRAAACAAAKEALRRLVADHARAPAPRCSPTLRRPVRQAPRRARAARPGRDRRHHAGRQDDAGRPGVGPLPPLRPGRVEHRPAAAGRHAHHRAGARRDHRRHRAPGAGRRGRLHRLLQLPDHQHGRQARPGAGHGQHRRGEAAAAGPARRHPHVRAVRGGRLPARRGERRERVDTVAPAEAIVDVAATST